MLSQGQPGKVYYYEASGLTREEQKCAGFRRVTNMLARYCPMGCITVGAHMDTHSFEALGGSGH